jgi:hypothetical protein
VAQAVYHLVWKYCHQDCQFLAALDHFVLVVQPAEQLIQLMTAGI